MRLRRSCEAASQPFLKSQYPPCARHCPSKTGQGFRRDAAIGHRHDLSAFTNRDPSSRQTGNGPERAVPNLKLPESVPTQS